MTNVLLIEDDDDTVEEISGYLRHRGFTIDRAADGEAGLARAFQGSAEILIVDRMLPLLDGLTMLTRLRQRWRGRRKLIEQQAGACRISSASLPYPLSSPSVG